MIKVVRSSLKALAIVSLVSMALAGCGIRGSLDAPPEAKADGTANSAEAGAAGANSAATPKPHRGFILDSLLR